MGATVHDIPHGTPVLSTELEGQQTGGGDPIHFTAEELLVPALVSGIPGYSPNQVISGGGVAWAGGLNFDVAAAVYAILGTRYASPATRVTLADANATFDRIDVIAVNDAGAVVVVEGLAAATPIKPDIDDGTQLELTFVSIPATSPVPTVTAIDVYRENVEWTTTKSGAGIALASTSNPHGGTKCIEATAATSGQWFDFESPTTLDTADSDSLVFYLRSKAAWPTTRTLTLVWVDASAHKKGSIVTLRAGTFGFDGAPGDYQLVVIPLALFNAAGNAVKHLRVTVAGSGTALGFYFDDCMLQTGGSPSVLPGAVRSVAGRVGDVVLSVADIVGLGTANGLDADTDTTLAANSDLRVATQKAAKAYVDALRAYVDSAVAGLKWKQTVKAATTANGTLASAYANGSVVDGVTLATGDRVLLKDQTAGAENGIYLVNASGAPTRATDADSGAELVSATVIVERGSVNAEKAFTCSNDTITLGSTAIVFVAFAAAISGALIATNNLSDLTSTTSARSNLGLGSVATLASDTDTALAANSDSNVATQKAVKAYADGLAKPYDVGGGIAGAPAASAVISRIPFTRTVVFPSGLTASQGALGTAATAQTDFDIKKNGSSVGTMRFAAAGSTASFIMASQTTFSAGDVMTVVAPASPDATAADLGFVLAGTR